MSELSPSALLREYFYLFEGRESPGPVLDLACGDCRNGIFVAQSGLEVICCDRDSKNLAEARRIAGDYGVHITTWEADLEIPGGNPLPEGRYGAILVFRYLHRPLISFIRKALRPNGLLFYETFTAAQPRFGKPRNPAFLLEDGELLKSFDGWQVIHYFEGIKKDPPRAIAQIVCRKPGLFQRNREVHEEHES